MRERVAEPVRRVVCNVRAAFAVSICNELHGMRAARAAEPMQRHGGLARPRAARSAASVG
ncbi:hypothetical protein [Burkholderia dolosa]|uniref:hypothetical protein n=1 Tax=Burkholderia dolosa TaxID=152500 RepID=UPI001B9CFB81|nr:hypothetical protein [Burkholderia dolosa]MBR8061358.1 hypothetical protein [Burkholderia dolosa]